MSTDRDIESKKDTEGKNKDKIYCTFCPSKMLNAGVARFINMDVSISTVCSVYVNIEEIFTYDFLLDYHSMRV